LIPSFPQPVKDFNDDSPGERVNRAKQPRHDTHNLRLRCGVVWRDRATQRKGVDTPSCLAAAWRANHQPPTWRM